MKIQIVVPFEDADRMVPVWAYEEETINFKQESEKAARCTCSYAATELKKYISKTIRDAYVFFSYVTQKEQFDLCIELYIKDYSSRCDEFTMEFKKNVLVITGSGRTGLLYGAYEFLRLQGWRWYSPGDEGEIQPSLREELTLPEHIINYIPSMSSGRGFDFAEWYTKDSNKFWIWMSRNRMNVASYRTYTAALCDKLGMQYKNGSHIFEKYLDPERIMPSGKTLWNEHIEWFGVCPDGTRKKEMAQKIQFCVSNEELVKFLFEYLLTYIIGIWKNSDRIDVWGFDTWGNSCSCSKCKALGNSTDQNIHLMSQLRNHLNQALKDGRLDHNIKMVLCGYEGTCTLSGPDNPLPANMVEAGDIMVYYPIRRCYAHDFSDEACEINTMYRDALKSWLAKDPTLTVAIGEYYNVSKFEELPIIFSQRIANDIPYYHNMGVRAATYMHIPMVNWGMRTLTQVLFAQISWDIKTNVPKFIDEYFINWYGPYASQIRKAYELVEEAFLYCTDWRAWGPRSVLSHLLNWDGTRPEKPFEVDNHLKNADGILENGNNSIMLLKKALEIVDEIRNLCKLDYARNSILKKGVGMNPDDAHAHENYDKYSTRVSEGWRLLIYAFDTMNLMTEVVAYYHALYKADNTKAEEAWSQIEEFENSMDSYYIPIGYEYPGTGIESKDALSRSQLRDVVTRCRKYRLG